MESNIKGLVAAGHEMASELKAECGAVDMRSVAKLISDLATQLEVQLVRANALAEDHQSAIESIKQADSAVKLAHEKFSALAAENAGLKHAMAVTLEHVSVTDAGQAGVAAMIINDALHHSETPATDAFLAEGKTEARKEGAYFVANRMLAAWKAGFIDDTAKNAEDIARMILTSTEFMTNAPESHFDRSFSDGVLEDIAEQLRKRSHPMSKIDYQVLREIAKKATQGEWSAFISPGTGTYAVHTPGDKRCEDVIKWIGFDGQKNAENNARYIAVFNPEVVQALLDERERNQQYIKRRDQENEDIALTVGKLRVELEAAEKRNAKLQSENAYIRNKYKELDLLIGKNILVMQAAIVEWQSTGDAKSGLAWIYNTLFGPGELPDESEKDAQAYFNRKYAPIDEKLMELHKWFWEQSEAERAAGIRIKGE